MKRKHLYLMVGVAGSGKSTWLKHNARSESCIVSRDAIRFSMVSEDEPYFSREREVFNQYVLDIQAALNSTAYEAVYCDATHLNESARNKLLDRLDLTNVETIYAVVVRPSLEETLKRNSNRQGRLHVPEDVIKRMYATYTDPLHDKKYHCIPIYVELANDILVDALPQIWITSDLHFNHNREFIFKPRGFETVEEMNEAIVQRWNEKVSPYDEVYVLGDLMLGSSTDGIEYIKRLNGSIHIILGNHDTDTRVNLYYSLPNVVEVALAAKLNYKKYHFFMTHYPCLTGNLEKETLTQMTLNLYGHTHQKSNFYNDMPYMYHVGVDSHDCYPVLLDDIIKEMNDKVKECKEYL